MFYINCRYGFYQCTSADNEVRYCCDVRRATPFSSYALAELVARELALELNWGYFAILSPGSTAPEQAIKPDLHVYANGKALVAL